MDSELVKFFAHGEARDSNPAGSFRLVALSEFDGAAKQFALGLANQAGVNIIQMPVSSLGKECVNELAQALAAGVSCE